METVLAEVLILLQYFQQNEIASISGLHKVVFGHYCHNKCKHEDNLVNQENQKKLSSYDLCQKFWANNPGNCQLSPEQILHLQAHNHHQGYNQQMVNCPNLELKLGEDFFLFHHLSLARYFAPRNNLHDWQFYLQVLTTPPHLHRHIPCPRILNYLQV